jgi:putative transposase
MTNHVHLIATPSDAISISKAIQTAHSRYAARFNYRQLRNGHLWESRFFSCPLDEPHLIQALLYVDRNPVRAGIVVNTEDYQWSSARAHISGRDPSGLIDEDSWNILANLSDYPDLLRKEEDSAFIDLIRRSTKSGRTLIGV